MAQPVALKENNIRAALLPANEAATLKENNIKSNASLPKLKPMEKPLVVQRKTSSLASRLAEVAGLAQRVGKAFLEKCQKDALDIIGVKSSTATISTLYRSAKRIESVRTEPRAEGVTKKDLTENFSKIIAADTMINVQDKKLWDLCQGIGALTETHYVHKSRSGRRLFLEPKGADASVKIKTFLKCLVY